VTGLLHKRRLEGNGMTFDERKKPAADSELLG
jgi:hypothetical protein